MDFVLAEAGKRGLKVIMVLADNWYKTNGIDNYVEWGGSSKHQDFFTSGYIRQLYKNNIAFLAKRVNPLTGVRYADDTTIMAWNVANEARCQGCGNGPMQNWCVRSDPWPGARAHAHRLPPLAQDKRRVLLHQECGAQPPGAVPADDLKPLGCLKPRRMCVVPQVGLGYEGFYGPDSGRTAMNPADWASREGQNYVANSQIGCACVPVLHLLDCSNSHLSPPPPQASTTSACTCGRTTGT